MDNDTLEYKLNMAETKLKQVGLKWKILVALLFVGILCYTGLTIRHKQLVEHASGLEAQVQGLSAQAAQAEAQMASVETAKAQIAEQNTKLKAENDQLRRQLPLMPAPAAKPPTQASDKALALEKLGLAPGVRVTLDPLPSLLGSPDADKAIIWGEEALRVPALTSRIGALESLDEANKNLVQGLITERMLGDAALADCKKALGLEALARETSEDRGAALIKAGKVQSLRFKCTLYIGIPIAALAGYRLGRR